KSNDARDDVWPAAAAQSLAGLIEVDTVESSGEAIAVALATDLAVGQDVDAGTLHVADRDLGGVVLGLLQKLFGDAPDLFCSAARWQSGVHLLAIYEAVELRIAAHHCGGYRVIIHFRERVGL